MPVLEIKHPDLSYQPMTYLSAALAAAGATLTVENTAGFTASDEMIVGGVGEEKTEGILVHASPTITSTTVTTVSGGVSFAHGIGTPVTRSDFDQIKIHSSTTETGTFTELAASPINIDWEAPLTRYDDTVSASTAWFKVQYYHSIDTTTSTLSDAFQPSAGFKVRSLQAMINNIRRLLKLEDNQRVITNAEITDMLNESQLDLSAERNFPFLETTGTGSTTDSTQTVALPTDIKPGSLSDLNILYSGNNYHPSYVTQGDFLLLDISDGLETDQGSITHYTIIGSTVYFFPIPSSTGSSDVTFYYTKVPDTLDEINEQSNFPEVSYFVYDVAHKIALSLNKQTKILDRLNDSKFQARNRMMKYGTKQSTGPTRVRRMVNRRHNPEVFQTITT